MKKNQPQKRLGRGLENLINGGLNKPTPPSVHIDGIRIGTSDTNPVAKQDGAGASSSSLKPATSKDIVKDLNDLLKKTREEAEMDSLLPEVNDATGADEDISAQEPSVLPKPAHPALNGTTTGNAVPQNFPMTPAAKDAGKPSTNSTGVFMLIPVPAIKISPFQRRKEFSTESLKELADSIRSEGLMQPVVVRTLPEGGYELIAGERRMRACQSIGMEVIPARVVSVPDTSAAVMGLIENLQRVDLNPVEEARGYGMLLTDFHMTQEQISERVGKPRSTVANSLRLLLLEPEILGYVAKGQLTLGHAKVLLGLQEGAHRVMLARSVIEQGLSVRQTEAMTRKASAVNGSAGSNVPSKRLASAEEMAVVMDLQKRVVARLNAKVNLNHTARGGRMVIYYKSNAELEGILKRMGV